MYFLPRLSSCVLNASCLDPSLIFGKSEKKIDLLTLKTVAVRSYRIIALSYENIQTKILQYVRILVTDREKITL